MNPSVFAGWEAEFIYPLQAMVFLQQMVRILSGTLIEVGAGKRKPEEMAAILKAGDRSIAGFTAPPEGLFLEKVEYGDLI